MLMATAVVGAGPPVGSDPDPVVVFEAIVALTSIDPVFIEFSRFRESVAATIEYSVVDGKGPVRLHDAEYRLYNSMAFGSTCPTVVTTDVGSMFEVALSSSQLI
jgi:hypothetical protein